MKLQTPKAHPPTEGRVFSGRVRVRVEPLDFKGRPMPGSKSFIVLETTLDEVFTLVYSNIKSEED